VFTCREIGALHLENTRHFKYRLKIMVSKTLAEKYLGIEKKLSKEKNEIGV
jgi:hypothetical protein